MKIASKLIVAVAALAMLPVVKACASSIVPSSNLITKTVSVGNFDEIDAAQVKVIVRVGNPTGTAKITAPDNIIEKLKISNSGNELKIGFQKNFNIKGSSKTTVEITVPTLKEIEANLSAKIEIRGQLNTSGKLELCAGTSGTILMGKATASSVDMEVGTSGTISIQQLSATGTAECEASTSGAIKINKLACSKIKAEANTSGAVSVSGGHADEADLEANTSGAINVSPMNIETGKAEANTGGSVKCNIRDISKIITNTGGRIRNK